MPSRMGREGTPDNRIMGAKKNAKPSSVLKKASIVIGMALVISGLIALGLIGILFFGAYSGCPGLSPVPPPGQSCGYYYLHTFLWGDMRWIAEWSIVLVAGILLVLASRRWP